MIMMWIGFYIAMIIVTGFAVTVFFKYEGLWIEQPIRYMLTPLSAAMWPVTIAGFLLFSVGWIIAQVWSFIFDDLTDRVVLQIRKVLK